MELTPEQLAEYELRATMAERERIRQIVILHTKGEERFWLGEAILSDIDNREGRRDHRP